VDAAVTALRQLWCLRRAVIGSALLAAMIGLLIPYHVGFPPTLTSREHRVGVASTSALIDTPTSQVADLGRNPGTDVGTLAARASLLASLMTNSPIRDEIARRAGIPPRTLIATPPATVGPAPSPSPAASDGTMSESDPRASILRTSVPTVLSGQMPIIAVDAQAPDAARAARLANASLAVLKAHVESVAGTDRVPDPRRLVVRQLGPAFGTLVTRGPSPLLGVLAAIGIFTFACCAILAGTALAAAWRRADERDDAEEMVGMWQVAAPGHRTDDRLGTLRNVPHAPIDGGRGGR
jgi:hypothetical protein